MGLPCGVSFMILASTVFVQSTRVTDVQTSRIVITYTRYSIYAVARKNLIKCVAKGDNYYKTETAVPHIALLA